jgi:SAM-dependent methyltransferase
LVAPSATEQKRVSVLFGAGDSGTLVGVLSASHIAHASLPFANPTSEAAVDAAIAALPLPSAPSILDVGCGTGQIMLRALRKHAPARGLGVDLDADAIAEARDRAADLQVLFEARDADTIDDRFDAVINVAASHAQGGFPAVLDALRALAPVALYGEGFWRRTPSEDFLAALGGATADELSDLRGLRSAIREAGFEVVHESFATDRDWAYYEETLAAQAERHGAPHSLEYAHRIRDRRRLPHGTDTLGFVLVVLTA